MKFYILDNGWETLDKSFFIAGANSATASNRNPETEWINIPIQAYLIEHEDGWILFDTGCDPDWERNWPAFIPEQSPYYVTEEQLLLNRLAQLGVAPEDIRYVVISHLHVDHAGNLHHFKNAQVIVSEEEFTATLKAFVTGRGLDVHVPSDIRHSFGMVAMKVELEHTGPLLVVADAIYFEENVKPEIQVPGILYDSLGFRRSAQYLLDYAKRTGAKILYGHDMAQFETLIKSHQGYYD